VVLSGAGGSDLDEGTDGCLTLVGTVPWEWDGTAQGLIDNAADGDTVTLPCGDYDERVSITNSITLIGEVCSDDRAQQGPRVRKGAGIDYSERQDLDVSLSNLNLGGDDYADSTAVVHVEQGVSGSLTITSVTIDAGGSGEAAVNTGGVDFTLTDSDVLNSSGIVIGTDDCASYDLSGNDFVNNSNNLAAGSCDVSGSGNFFDCAEGLECGGAEGTGLTDSACDADGNVLDECGVCGGDGTSCAPDFVDITYDSDTDIYGFQFSVDGATVLGVSGGASADSSADAPPDTPRTVAPSTEN
jgi:hypothetical protein